MERLVHGFLVDTRIDGSDRIVMLNGVTVGEALLDPPGRHDGSLAGDNPCHA
jgi:hypothetical protein